MEDFVVTRLSFLMDITFNLKIQKGLQGTSTEPKDIQIFEHLLSSGSNYRETLTNYLKNIQNIYRDFLL